MRRPSDEQLVRAWEWGRGRSLPERALALLALALPECSLEALYALTVGERDSGLLSLREQLFGARIAATTRCPDCREALELAFTVSDVRADERPTVRMEVSEGDWRVALRPLTGGDLADVARREGDGGVAALLRRCVLSVHLADIELQPGDLPGPVLAAVETALAAADPQAEIELELRCAHCKHTFTQIFDPTTFLWTEVDLLIRRLFREVHVIASAYGWSESQILALGGDPAAVLPGAGRLMAFLAQLALRAFATAPPPVVPRHASLFEPRAADAVAGERDEPLEVALRSPEPPAPVTNAPTDQGLDAVVSTPTGFAAALPATGAPPWEAGPPLTERLAPTTELASPRATVPAPATPGSRTAPRPRTEGQAPMAAAEIPAPLEPPSAPNARARRPPPGEPSTPRSPSTGTAVREALPLRPQIRPSAPAQVVEGKRASRRRHDQEVNTERPSGERSSSHLDLATREPPRTSSRDLEPSGPMPLAAAAPRPARLARASTPLEINVHIDHVEVRAATSARTPARAPSAALSGPALGLDQYLSLRRGGGRS